jgi:hypothetical protein
VRSTRFAGELAALKQYVSLLFPSPITFLMPGPRAMPIAIGLVGVLAAQCVVAAESTSIAPVVWRVSIPFTAALFGMLFGWLAGMALVQAEGAVKVAATTVGGLFLAAVAYDAFAQGLDQLLRKVTLVLTRIAAFGTIPLRATLLFALGVVAFLLISLAFNYARLRDKALEEAKQDKRDLAALKEEVAQLKAKRA